MATSEELLLGLVDDAGLFPPEELGMAAAVARHHADRAAASPVLTHRFVCPVGRFPELLGQLTRGDRVDMLALGPATEQTRHAIEQVAQDPRLSVVGLETVLPDDASGREVALAVAVTLTARFPGFEVYAEVGTRPVRVADLDLLARHGHRAKVRCGGVRRELFPTAAELAAFIAGAVERDLPFKATAGLHHPVTHTDARTGFDHFGFLNLLAATAMAIEGETRAGLEAVLLERDPAAVVAAARVAEAGDVRDLFCSFGSCSTSEPLDDLGMLGLLDPAPTLRSVR